MRRIMMALFGLASVATVHAKPIPVNFLDVVDPQPDILLNATPSSHSYVYYHDLNDQGFSPLYHIQNANLTVTLEDNNDPNGRNEYARIKLEDVLLIDYLEVDYGNYAFDVNSRYLQKDGLLEVRLTAREGNFYFRRSELDVDTLLVPEPGTMALTGFGLLALGFLARRRRK